MANEKNTAARPLLRDLFRLEVFKRSQGRIARQVTFVVLAITVVLSVASANNMTGQLLAWLFEKTGLATDGLKGIRYLVNGLIVVAGVWVCYRAVNFPRFADFLIAVEAEMNKVSWPGRRELMRSSIVVIVTIFSLAILLFAYDFVWGYLLRLLGITG